jgi:hypothetical protein
MSRSGGSVALQEWRAWGLIDAARSPGNRRDFFVAHTDPWELARRVIAERQRRDLAPVLDRLQDIAAMSGDTRAADLIELLGAASAFTANLAQQDVGDLKSMMAVEDDEASNKKKKKKKKG